MQIQKQIFFSIFQRNFNLAVESGQKPRLEQILEDLEENSEELLNISQLPLYRYVYDDKMPNRLTNGGENLFDPYGMEVCYVVIFIFLNSRKNSHPYKARILGRCNKHNWVTRSGNMHRNEAIIPSCTKSRVLNNSF